MRQFQTQTRTFHYRARRSPVRLRYIVLPVLAVLLAYATGIFSPATATEPVTLAAASTSPAALDIAAEEISPEDMNRIAAEMAQIEPGSSTSLKEAFEAAPAPASYELGKGAPGALANIQQKINRILDAGGAMLKDSKTLAVGKGDTLMELLIDNNVPRGDAHQAIEALRKVYDPRSLNVGHEITVFFHQDPAVADPQFSGLAIEKDVVSTVMVERTDAGGYTAAQKDKNVHGELRAFRGEINGSLYVSADHAGMTDSMIIDLIRMYSWNVDFQRDIQPGDKFELMVEEQVTEDGRIVPGQSSIVYARLTLSGRDMPYYLYKDADGDMAYFDDEGQTARKALMKTPVDGARISSGYGMRKHPVLGYSKMHKGMDFAAPRGTPIYAAGDGVIRKMGRLGGYGNYVRISHSGGLDTAYAHLNGFKSGLKSGSRVKQGQVIGYVGTTGRSTGPHLHYEILMNGKQVNPRSIKLPTGKALAKKDMEKFKSHMTTANRKFRTLSQPTTVASNTRN